MLTDIRALADHFLIALPNINTPSLPANVNGFSVIRFALFCLEMFVFSIFMVLAKLFMLSLGTVTHSTSTQKYEIGF